MALLPSPKLLFSRKPGNVVILLICGILYSTISKGQTEIWADSCIRSSFIGKMHQPNFGISQFRNVHESHDGDIIATGFIFPNLPLYPSQNQFGLVAKISPAGQIRWIKYVGASNLNSLSDSDIWASTVCKNGDIFVINNSGLGEGSIHIVRVDPNGNIRWQQRFNSNSAFDRFYQVIELSDGGFLMGGSNSMQTVLIKVDGQGNKVWRKYYTNLSYSNLKSIVETPTAYYTTGQYDGPNVTGAQTYINKLNKSNGDTIWTRGFAYVTASNDYNLIGYSRIDFTNNQLYLHGSTHASYMGTQKPAQFLIGVTEAGVITSAKKFENSFTEMERASIWGGRTYDTKSRSGVHYSHCDTCDPYVYRLNDQYQQIWSWRIPNIGQEYISDLQVMEDSSIILGGINSTFTGSDAFIIKTTKEGVLENCTVSPSQVIVTDFVPSAGIPTVFFSNPPDTSSNIPSSIEVFDGIDYNWSVQCISEASCRLGKIQGPDTVCTGRQFIYKTTRSGGCSSPISFTVNNPSAQIQILSDTSVSIQFTGADSILLIANMQAFCGVLKDSIWITALSDATPVALGEDKFLCQVSLDLKAGPGYKSYNWSNGSQDSILTVSATGRYYVTVTDYCDNISSDTIDVLAAPVISYSMGNDTAICLKDTLRIIAPAGFTNYQWSSTYNIIHLDSMQVKVFPARDTFYISSAEKFNGCTVKDTLWVQVNNRSLLYAGKDSSICRNDSILFTATPGFVSYSWNTGATGQSIQAKQTGQYIVVATDPNGCISSDSVNLDLFENPVPQISRYTTICTNSPRILSVTPSFTSYQWQDNSQGTQFSAIDTGWYAVRVTDNHNCIGRDSIHITQYSLPASGFLGKDTAVCIYSPITLLTGGNFTSYSWSTGSQTSTISIIESGHYFLTVTDANGCSGTDTILVKESVCTERLVFPNAFTPNNDQHNDVFKPIVRGVPQFYKLTIFNRWGQRIFETTDFTTGWDGKIGNHEQLSGGYIYSASYRFGGKETLTLKGSFVLIR